MKFAGKYNSTKYLIQAVEACQGNYTADDISNLILTAKNLELPKHADCGGEPVLEILHMMSYLGLRIRCKKCGHHTKEIFAAPDPMQAFMKPTLFTCLTRSVVHWERQTW